MDLDTDVGTHVSLCNTLSSNKLCPKTVKILAVKGLRELDLSGKLYDNGQYRI